MNKYLKILLCIFLAIFLIKLVLAELVPSPTMFADEYVYSKLARSFFYSQEFSVHGMASNSYPPLYPMLLSTAYFAKDMQLVYFFMKLINVLISSLIIFPAYLLAKEKLSSRDSVFAAIIVSVFPANFAFSQFVMAENIFYFLFLSAFYLLYKSFDSQKLKYCILAGVFIAMAVLAKVIGLALLVLAMLAVVYLWFKKTRSLNFIAILIIPLLAYGAWALRNVIVFSASANGVLGSYSTVLYNNVSLPAFAVWLSLYFAYFLLAGALILPLAFLYSEKRDLLWKLTMMLTIIVIVFLAERASVGAIKSQTMLSWLGGRPIGRYADMAVMPLLVSGFIALKQGFKQSKLIAVACIVSLLAASQLVYFSLFPANNISLTAFGAFSFLLNLLNFNSIAKAVIFAALLLGVFAAALLMLKRTSARRIAAMAVLFFILTSLLAYSVSYYNSANYWQGTAPAQAGHWLGGVAGSTATILFDVRDCSNRDIKNTNALCAEQTHSSITGFWINSEILFADPTIETRSADYIVSQHELALERFKDFPNNIHIYKLK